MIRRENWASVRKCMHILFFLEVCPALILVNEVYSFLVERTAVFCLLFLFVRSWRCMFRGLVLFSIVLIYCIVCILYFGKWQNRLHRVIFNFQMTEYVSEADGIATTAFTFNFLSDQNHLWYCSISFNINHSIYAFVLFCYWIFCCGSRSI